MLKNLQRYFTDTFQSEFHSTDKRDHQHALHLATAVLLVEVSRADHSIDQEELKISRDSLQQLFRLRKEEAEDILDLAEQEAEKASSLYQFNYIVDKHLNNDQKIALLELIWQVGNTDNSIHRYEEYIIRKLADLLHVPHRHFIKAKHKGISR